MRGHLGFRLPRADFLEARVTQLAVDELEYINSAQPIAAITQFNVDDIEYSDPTQPIGALTVFTLDTLIFAQQQNEPRISRMTVDALTYIVA